MKSHNFSKKRDTICAIATPGGTTAISIIRVSGKEAIGIVNKIFTPKSGPSLSEGEVRRLRFGTIYKDGEYIDEVMVACFAAPHSYTGEDSVEIFCHGSPYIRNEITMLLFNAGAREAEPGEFSLRSFLNGKMDLSQAEAVADLIASETSAAHRVAATQMRGGFTTELAKMRKSLLNIVSLMELELDFSDEDVEFADRSQLSNLLGDVIEHIEKLIDSFALGNIIKNGVPVAIVGATNTGKSTLLNTLLGEERAIVSDIHGTTRDFIEDTVNLQGTRYRFIDTAGIRKTDEKIEILGIERTFEKIIKANIIILMLDGERPDSFQESLERVTEKMILSKQSLIITLNKTDILSNNKIISNLIDNINDIAKNYSVPPIATIPISAKEGLGIDKLKAALTSSTNISGIPENTLMVTNARHHQALILSLASLERVNEGLNNNTTTDLLTQDIREALFHLGEIVGEINTEEILGNIFSKFCIGK